MTTDVVWVIVERRHSFDIDDQPISRVTLVEAAGFFADKAAAVEATEALNAHLYAEYDQFVAQQFRAHSAAVKAYERAMLERKVIIDAGLIPSAAEPTKPAPAPADFSFADFLAHLHATSPYKKFEAVALHAATAVAS